MCQGCAGDEDGGGEDTEQGIGKEEEVDGGQESTDRWNPEGGLVFLTKNMSVSLSSRSQLLQAF